MPTILCVLLAAVVPVAAQVAQGLAGGVAVVVSWVRLRARPAIRCPLLGASALLAVGAAVGTLSRPGWPLCEPGSWVQGHAVWHVLAAAALWVVAPAVGSRPTTGAGAITAGSR